MSYHDPVFGPGRAGIEGKGREGEGVPSVVLTQIPTALVGGGLLMLSSRTVK